MPFLYDKEGTITLEEVQTFVRSKELSKINDLKIGNNGECLSVLRGRSKHTENWKGKRSKSESKSKYKDFL